MRLPIQRACTLDKTTGVMYHSLADLASLLPVARKKQSVCPQLSDVRLSDFSQREDF